MGTLAAPENDRQFHFIPRSSEIGNSGRRSFRKSSASFPRVKSFETSSAQEIKGWGGQGRRMRSVRRSYFIT